MSATYAGGGYARRGYARDNQDETRTGGVILAFVSSLSALLVILGLFYATGASQRHKALLAAADCEPSLYIPRLPCTTQQALINQYEAITTPAVQQLNADVAAYNADERNNLAAAEATLTAEVATEQAFENNLAAATFTPENRARADALIQNATSFGTPVPLASVTFTPQTTVMVNKLIQDLQTVAKLTEEQARSTSLSQLRSFNGPVNVATAAAQAGLKLIRQALSARPTASEEPGTG